MSIPKSQDIKTFSNPSGFWEYIGPFSVELTRDANKSFAPSDAKIEGDIITFDSGRIVQSLGGIQLYSTKHFTWGYKFIKVIRDGEGNLLWVNYNYR